jgi:hypothetical protein
MRSHKTSDWHLDRGSYLCKSGIDLIECQYEALEDSQAFPCQPLDRFAAWTF